jgi:hypothetical protein
MPPQAFRLAKWDWQSSNVDKTRQDIPFEGLHNHAGAAGLTQAPVSSTLGDAQDRISSAPTL